MKRLQVAATGGLRNTDATKRNCEIDTWCTRKRRKNCLKNLILVIRKNKDLEHKSEIICVPPLLKDDISPDETHLSGSGL